MNETAERFVREDRIRFLVKSLDAPAKLESLMSFAERKQIESKILGELAVLLREEFLDEC